MKDILPYLKPYRRRIALAMLLVAAATVCDLLLPTIMNDILNNGVRQSDFAYIVRCCAWMLAVAAAGLAALLAGRKISCDVVAGFNADLRTDVFSLVNNMTFEEFNSIGAAALLSRSTYDIGTVSWVASMISGSLITIPVLFFGGVVLAFSKALDELAQEGGIRVVKSKGRLDALRQKLAVQAPARALRQVHRHPERRHARTSARHPRYPRI